jgi:osmotically inducible lipoprotein OsmB
MFPACHGNASTVQRYAAARREHESAGRMDFKTVFPLRGTTMKTIQRISVSAVAVSILLGLCGCAGMDTRQKDTAGGAGIGAVSGALLLGGPVGVLGGAAVGAVIGDEVGKGK